MKHSGGEKGATMVEIIMILGILGALSVSIATLVNSPTGVTAMFPLQPS